MKSTISHRHGTPPLERSLPESEWIARLRLGDRAAFEALFRTYYEELSIFAWQFVRDRSVAEDLVQDLFVRIWEQRATWRPQASIRGYLLVSTRNRALNYLKHEQVEQTRRVEAQIAVPEEGKRADEDLLRGEVTEAFEQMLETLPEGQRTVFLLSRRHGLTYAEMAAVLGISVKTIETQMGRALKRLRERASSCLGRTS